MSDSVLKCDTVVIGGGISGIVSALELLNFGQKVILLERDTKENFGGLAAKSFGGMFFVNTPHQKRTGIRDNIDLALSDWKSYADFSENDYWPQKWAEQYVNLCTDKVYDWLKGNKINFFPVVHWVERGLLKPGNSVPRFHMVWGTGYELVKTCINKLSLHPKAQENLKILFTHKAEEFELTNNKITSINGINEKSNIPFSIEATNFVVATGGIGGSIEKVKENWYKPWGVPPETILNGSHPYSDGVVHQAVKNINGNITHLERMWNYAAGVHHPKPHFEGHGLSLVPCKSALWLNYKGERIGPIPLITAYDTRYLVEQICKQEKKYSWQILNRKIALKEFAISGSEHNPAIKNKKFLKFISSVFFGNSKLVNEMLTDCKDFVVANSIEELVKKMNALQGTEDVDAGIVKKVINTYDGQIERGIKFHNDDQLMRIAHARQYSGDKTRTCKFQKIDDKGAYPLIAIREFILSRKSLGGIQTNLLCQVLSNSNKVIDGLYAVGEASGFGGGGMHGFRALEGTFLGGSILNGRIAAYAIAGKSFTK